jgi:hypothetical protein
MQTGGYDVVAEISEKLANKCLSIAYYLGKFPTFEGTYALPIDVPASLKDFTQVNYEIALTGPPVMATAVGGKATVAFMGQAKFTVLGGVEVGTETQFQLQVTPTFDTSKRTFSVNFGGAQIESLALTGFTNVKAGTTERLKTILSAEINKYLAETVGTIELTPSLMSTENNWNFNIAGLSTTASTFNLAANILQRQGGNPNQIRDFCQDSHIALGVTVDAMQRTFANWWNQTPSPKVIVNEYSKTLDLKLPGWADTAKSWMSTAAFGFLFDVDVDPVGLRFSFTANVGFDHVRFSFHPGNRITVAGVVTLDIEGNVDLLYDIAVEALLGLYRSKTKHKEKNLFTTGNLVPVPILLNSATAEIGLDSHNRIVAKIVDFDISIPLVMPDVPDFGLDVFKNDIKAMIADFIGNIDLGPAVIDGPIPGTDLTVVAEINRLTCDGQEALVGVKTKTLGVGDYAPYMCNKDKGHMEIHKKECQHAGKIAAKNRAYYIDLQEALDDGFDGCSFCLHDYHTR